MEKKKAPSEPKAQALRVLLQGQAEGQNGEELLSLLVRLSTERCRLPWRKFGTAIVRSIAALSGPIAWSASARRPTRRRARTSVL